MSEHPSAIYLERDALHESSSFYLTEEQHPENGTMLGFWLYLMSDSLIFAVLFATYGVLGGNYAGGPGPKELFDLNLVAVNTALLLASSITYGFAMIEMHHRRLTPTMIWLAVTGALGLGFLAIELYEFHHLIHIGAGPDRSAFLSSFFTLVGTHGLHVAFGCLWLGVLLVQLKQRGIEPVMIRRVSCLSLFWHFLDVVWIGVFSFVYLIGVVR
ncbi:MAG: cytochrome o ubiquinol oxidase subunit III [Salinisphaeraceae bacterium]|jgi:cytochrome o ubiquinol oxidase subunit 3|nr:cytochrome o ubiquinol oxidase subunit III [Salinisphaeraceae bacterium]